MIEKNREISKFSKKKVNQMWAGRVCEWPGENGVPGKKINKPRNV